MRQQAAPDKSLRQLRARSIPFKERRDFKHIGKLVLPLDAAHLHREHRCRNEDGEPHQILDPADRIRLIPREKLIRQRRHDEADKHLDEKRRI